MILSEMIHKLNSVVARTYEYVFLLTPLLGIIYIYIYIFFVLDIFKF